MRNKRLLVYPLLVLVVGAYTIRGSARIAERAGMVGKEPAVIDCEQLMADGPPENRFVQVTDCWFGQKCAVQADVHGVEWKYVLMPVYPLTVRHEAAGEQIGLVAKIVVRGEEELKEFLARQEVIGCVWDEYRDAAHYDTLIRNVYPKVAADGYRMVVLGGDLPTLAQARRKQTLGVSLMAIGMCLLLWMVWRFRRPLEGEQNQQGSASRDADRRVSQDAPDERPEDRVPVEIG
jgi:hypothetical protein